MGTIEKSETAEVVHNWVQGFKKASRYQLGTVSLASLATSSPEAISMLAAGKKNLGSEKALVAAYGKAVASLDNLCAAVNAMEQLDADKDVTIFSNELGSSKYALKRAEVVGATTALVPVEGPAQVTVKAEVQKEKKPMPLTIATIEAVSPDDFKEPWNFAYKYYITTFVAKFPNVSFGIYVGRSMIPHFFFWVFTVMLGAVVHQIGRKPEVLIDALFNLLGLLPGYMRYAGARMWARFQTRSSRLLTKMLWLEWAFTPSIEDDMVGLEPPEDSVLILKLIMLFYFSAAFAAYKYFLLRPK